MKRLRGVLLLLAQLCFAHYSTVGQATTLPGAATTPVREAPEALFGAQLGDADVDFFLSGSWTATLSGSLGWLFTPGGGAVFPEAFPGFESGQLFRQTPNLTVSVWLAERYFLEASVIGDFLGEGYEYFDENYLLLGYRGREDEFLRQVFIGTRDIAIKPYPFVDVPQAGSSSLGVSTLLAGGYSSHELLLRYDNNEPITYTFLGKNLLSEEILQLDSYVQGRFFKLPDAAVAGLELYIEDPDGDFGGSDGRVYRLAKLEDALLDSSAGTVSLKLAPAGSVLVYYSGLGDSGKGLAALPAESAGKIDLALAPENFEWDVAELNDYFGQDMDVRKVSVNGRLALRLWRPGEFSPFEILAAYPVEQAVPEDLSRVRISVTRKGSESPVSTALRYRLTPRARHFVVYESADLRASFRNLYPYLDDTGSGVFDPGNLLYGPLADPNPGYLQHELRVGYLTPVTEYRLGGEVVPGSVQVLRNGIAETRFELDESTGVLEFLTPISEGDRLEVRFRRRQSLANNGDLLFAWGNTVPLGAGHTLELATGLRWNALPGTYTTEAYSRTGSVVASAGLKGSIGPAAYKLSVAGAYTNPDTSGIMRLLGMESRGLEVSLSEAAAYPAAPPLDATIPEFPVAAFLDAGHRGLLLYKDFRSYGFAGTSALMSYTWDPPAEQVFPYATGSKPGPYVAGGSSDGEARGQSLVLDFELDDSASRKWVGTQLPVLSQEGLSDLSALEGVTVSFRAVDVSASSGGNFRVYLQLGDIGEDLDEDGILDRELSASASGFGFNDTANAAALKVGTSPLNESNGRLDSEDVDGNGFLDPEDPAGNNIVTVELTAAGPLAADSAWTILGRSFTAAEKAGLRRVRGMRLLIVEDGGGAVAGRVLIDRVILAGSRFWGDPPASVSAREVEEWAAADRPATPLAEAFPDVEELFHPMAEQQKVLEIQWSGDPDWSVRGFTEAATGGIDYRTIVYYYRLPSAGVDGDLSFSLRDSAGRGVSWDIPAFQTTAWREIRVDLEAGRVYRDGSPLAGATVSPDGSYGSLSVFRVALASSSLPDGLLYLDELHLTDPRAALGAALSLHVDIDLPGTLWEAGGHPILHDLHFRERGEFATRGFASLYGIPEQTLVLSSRSELEAGVSLADVSVALDLVAQEEEIAVGGSHRLTLPNVPFPLTVSDSYSYRERATGPALQRENSLTLDLAPLLLARVFNTAGNLDDVLTQEWGALLAVTPGPFSFQNTFELTLARSGFSVLEEGYFRNWVWGYTLLWPADRGGPLERKSALDLVWQLAPRPVGVELLSSLDLHSYEITDGSRSQASRFALDLSLPVELDGTGRGFVRQLRLEPGYRRTVDLVAREPSTGDVPEDFAVAFAGLASQGYSYSGVPFWELYDPAIGQRFLEESLPFDEAHFLAEPYLRISRAFGSRLEDLLLPSYLSIALDRSLEREGDLTRLSNHFNLQSRWRAVNLFGRFGSHPLFPAYRTDEFSTDVILGLRTEGGVARIDELRVEQALGFENGDAGSLSVENRLRVTLDEIVVWSDGVRILFDWFRRPENGVSLPLLPPRLGAGAFWSHQESLALTLSGAPAPAEATSFHPFNLIVEHESSLNLPDTGLLTARVGVGLDLERADDGQQYWRFGLEAALEVRLEF